MPSIRDTVLQYMADPEKLRADLDADAGIDNVDTLGDASTVAKKYVYWGTLLACAEEILSAHNDLHKRCVAEAKEKLREKIQATDGRASDISVLDEEVKKQARFVRIAQRCVTQLSHGVKALDKKQYMLSAIMHRETQEFKNIPADLETMKNNYIQSRTRRES